MKNEIFAQALTQLDDALLEDALSGTSRKSAPKRGLSLLRGLTAAAAVLAVLVCSLLFLRMTAAPEITVNGTPIGAEPVPVAAKTGIRLFDGCERVMLSLSLKRETTLSVSCGTLKIYRETEEIDAGTSFTGTGELRIQWIIPDADSRESHEMTVGNTTLRLSYSDAQDCWVIRRD